jgi:hypothetical protein
MEGGHDDDNPQCAIGSKHPLALAKRQLQQLNVTLPSAGARVSTRAACSFDQ